MQNSGVSQDSSGESVELNSRSEDSDEVETSFEEQGSSRWPVVLISGLTVLGVAAVAAYASIHSEEKAIGISAWVAVAVIGASTMIAALNSSRN